MAVEVATAYVSLLARTGKLEESIKASFTDAPKHAETAGKQIGERLARTASRAMKDGWKPDQDVMAGLPDTKLDRIGARIGQVIGKGVAGGLKAREAGKEFGQSFASGAGSVGMGSVISGWRKDLEGQSSKIGYAAGKAMSIAAQSAIALGAGAIGLTLKSGFDRLVTLDTAQYKLRQVLKTQGKDSDFERINKAVKASVEKTPFSLDQAFGTAVQAVGAGVSDIERFMKNVSDAAGFAGVDLARMGLIFNQVVAKGKLSGEETMQLMEAGIPARSWIQDSYKLTSDQFDKMQAKGEITMDMLQKSIEDHAPGMAKALGGTLQGSIDNMKTSMARAGANLLSAIFGGPTGDSTEGMKNAVNRITAAFEKLNQWITAHSGEIRQFFLNAKDAAGWLFDILGKITGALTEHPGLIKAVVGAFVAWKTIEGVTSLVSTLGKIGTILEVDLPGKADKAGKGIGAALSRVAVPAWLTYLMYEGLKDDPTWGNKGTVGNGGGILPPLLGQWGRNGYMGGNVSSIGGSAQGLKPNAAAMRNSIAAMFPQITDIGGWRPDDKYPDHPSGNAIDVMIPKELVGTEAGKALGDQIVAYAMQSGMAQYALWQQQDWRPGQGPSGMADRGSPTENHMDHVHIYTIGPALSPSASAPAAVVAPSGPGGGTQKPVSGGGGDVLKRLSGLYDTGGWLKPGYTLVRNETGQEELILNPEQQKALDAAGIKPDDLLSGAHTGSGTPPGMSSTHGGTGAAPGPTEGQAQTPDFLANLIRTQGFTPTGGGGVAGTSSLSKFLHMGNDVVGGLIDTGASLAQTAITAATTAAGGAAAASAGPGGPLAGMAASAAANYGIQLGAAQLKRISTLGFDLAGIGVDSMLAQMSPFGLPRWMGYDYAQFAPKIGIQQAALTTLEQMGEQAIEKAFPKPQEPSIAAPGTSASAMGPAQLAPPVNQVPQVQIGAITGHSPEEVARQITDQQRLAAMQFGGRP